MQYKVGNSIIKTENAAKPASQASSYLMTLLDEMDPVNTALDYGCGKLRYSPALKSRCKHLTLVDSEIQIGRTQMIRGEKCNVREYVKRYMKSTRVISVDEFRSEMKKYSLVLCANVLPVIPIEEERELVLQSLFRAVSPVGVCLFITQYRNSYFKEIQRSDKAQDHLDGWIVQSRRGPAYYGILGPEKLTGLVTKVGFAIKEQTIHEGSCYLFASAAG